MILSFSHWQFISDSTQAYGNNTVLTRTRYCMYAGDVDQDGFVDQTDVIAIYNDANNFVGGYVTSDLNGDDFVDLSDLSICDNNASNFVSVIAP